MLKQHYSHLTPYVTAEDFRRIKGSMCHPDDLKPDKSTPRPLSIEEVDEFARWSFDLSVKP